MHLMKHAGLNEQAMELSKPLTPLSDRRYEGRIAPVSLYEARGLCSKPKCVRHADHEGGCWPT